MATYKILYKRKKTDDTVRLYLRIIHNRVTRYFDTGIIVREKDFYKGRVKSSDTLHVLINKNIDKVIDQARAIEYACILNDESVSANKIAERMRQKETNSSVNAYIESLVEKERKYNNRARLKNASQTLLKFAGGQVLFKEIDVPFVKKYQNWLLNHYAKSTTHQHLTNLRAVINCAINEEIYEWKKHPFSGIKISVSHSASKDHLTEAELQKFAAIKLPAELSLARDYWMAMYYAGGARPKDMLLMGVNNIIDNRLQYTMGKTEDTNTIHRAVDLYIIPELMTIFNKYKGTKYIFPFVEDKLTGSELDNRINRLQMIINRQLTEISQRAGIRKVTRKMARKTVVYMLERRKVDLLSSGDMLNHSSATVTHEHYRVRQRENIDAAIKKLSLN